MYVGRCKYTYIKRHTHTCTSICISTYVHISQIYISHFLLVFICPYLCLFVHICLYLSLFVFICLYLSLFVLYWSLLVLICSLLVLIYAFISLFLFLFSPYFRDWDHSLEFQEQALTTFNEYFCAIHFQRELLLTRLCKTCAELHIPKMHFNGYPSLLRSLKTSNTHIL